VDRSLTQKIYGIRGACDTRATVPVWDCGLIRMRWPLRIPRGRDHEFVRKIDTLPYELTRIIGAVHTS